MGGGQSTAHSSTIYFIIPQYFSFVKYFLLVFKNYFRFLFFILRFQRAPCAAPRFPFTLQGRWLGFAVPILALSKREFPYFPFAQLLHISEMFSSLFFSVAGLLVLGLTSLCMLHKSFAGFLALFLAFCSAA